ncbi:MAG: carbohydrate binding domain-containing protein [Prevotella sp.]|nr:carbohydrate binding domain-containing protein [Prevotella sp.]
MKKTLLLILAAVFSLSMSASVTLDFTTNTWSFPEGSSNGVTEGTYTDSTTGYSISINASTSGYWNTSGYYMLGKANSTMTLPTMNFAVGSIAVVGHSGASSSVVQNIYVGETAVSTATTGADGVTNTYEIDSNYQTAGTQYVLEVTSAHNTQITSITFYEAGEVALTGEGTVDNPYTCADAVTLVTGGNTPSDVVYVKGTVSKIGSYYSNYQDMTYYISDDGETTSDQVEIYNGYGLGGEKITSEDYLSVGDEVVVYGTLTLYNSSTVEFNSGSSIYSINGETAPEVEVDMSDPYTSNTTWTNIEHAEVSDYAIIGENTYPIVKMGSSSADGSAYCTLPAGTTTFVFYAVAWTGTENTPYTVTLEGIGEKSYTANANSGLTGSEKTFTFVESEISAETDYHAITFDALTADTKLTVATTSTPYRIAIFGAKYYDSSTTIEGADTLDELSEDNSGEEGEGEEEETTISAGGLDTFENGGFEDWTEDGDPVGWVSVTSAGNGTVTQSEDAHGGTYSAQLHHTASGNKRLASKEFLLPAGTYSVSFYAKSVDADGLAEIAAGYAPSDTGTTDMGSYVYADYVYPSADEWTNITWEFTLEEETQLNLVIMNNKNGGGDVLIDDYTITSDSETGIHAIDAATAVGTGAMYNLSGQKVTESYRGIVIVDGKKVLNK